MGHEEYELKTADGKKLFAQSWAPPGKVRGAVALVHGFGGYSGRYVAVAERFVDAGFAVTGFDLPGHGKSAGNRGDASFGAIFEAIASHLEETRRRAPGAPVFLYGQSLGGALILKYAIERTPAISGAIASSPSVGILAPIAPWKIPLVRLMRSVSPSLVMNNPLELPAFSRDPKVVEGLRKDPLYHNKASARLGWDVLQLGEWFRHVHGTFPTPLLVMQGTGDRIVDPKATIDLAGRLTGDVTLKTWDGMYHELHNEPEKDQILGFMLAWMNGHV